MVWVKLKHNANFHSLWFFGSPFNRPHASLSFDFIIYFFSFIALTMVSYFSHNSFHFWTIANLCYRECVSVCERASHNVVVLQHIRQWFRWQTREHHRLFHTSDERNETKSTIFLNFILLNLYLCEFISQPAVAEHRRRWHTDSKFTPTIEWQHLRCELCFKNLFEQQP